MLPSRSYLLTDLSWVDVRAHVASESRLIVPVGASDQYGPHLPIGTGTLIAEAIAAELSQDFGILRSPTLPFGVALPTERRFPGAVSLREKTLHRLVNDLLGSWEDHGFHEFILITAHPYEPHVEAISTATSTAARVRVIEVLSIDFSEFLDGTSTAEHGGEAATSLMLYLHPDKVNMEKAEDYPPAGQPDRPRRLSRIPADSLGNFGRSTLATREKGQRIYQHIVQKIRTRVFLGPEEEPE